MGSALFRLHKVLVCVSTTQESHPTVSSRTLPIGSSQPGKDITCPSTTITSLRGTNWIDRNSISPHNGYLVAGACNFPSGRFNFRCCKQIELCKRWIILSAKSCIANRFVVHSNHTESEHPTLVGQAVSKRLWICRCSNRRPEGRQKRRRQSSKELSKVDIRFRRVTCNDRGGLCIRKDLYGPKWR